MKYCSKCGTELTDDAVFCQSCGCPQESNNSRQGFTPYTQQTPPQGFTPYTPQNPPQGFTPYSPEKPLQGFTPYPPQNQPYNYYSGQMEGQMIQKQKKSLFKRWWFWGIIAIIVLVIVIPKGNSVEKTPSGSKSQAAEVNTNKAKPSATSEPVSYTHYNVTDLFDDLESNALRAEQAHKNEYVEIVGYLNVIDSDGKYIAIGASPDDYTYILSSIHCTIKNKSQKETIMDLSINDKLIVRGKITSIGEVLGYYLDIDSIEKAN